jgi:hypothetical protein
MLRRLINVPARIATYNPASAPRHDLMQVRRERRPVTDGQRHPRCKRAVFNFVQFPGTNPPPLAVFPFAGGSIASGCTIDRNYYMRQAAALLNLSKMIQNDDLAIALVGKAADLQDRADWSSP